MTRLLPAIAVTLGTVACVDTPPFAEPEVDQSRVEVRELPASPLSKLDVLIVVDDSIAMAPYRDRVQALSSMLTDTLANFAEGWANVRIAVTTNDGKLRRVPTTNAPYAIDAREYDFTHRANYIGRLAETVAAMVDVGVDGTGPSQPLAAMVHALETNSQFLRDDSAFAVLMIGASDDASPFTVDEYVNWMKRLTGGFWRRRVVVVGLYPESAPRIAEYFRGIHEVGFAKPIDYDGDLRLALVNLLVFDRWTDLVGSPCLESTPLLLDPSAADDRYDCTMSVDLERGLVAVPQCDRARPDGERTDGFAPRATSACWFFRADPQNCTLENHLSLGLSGYTLLHHPALRLECRTR
ncbi:MAG TPA: hypothetical protein VFV99_23080 [Kofleriaceae bacterium]|nr:hypothetical protein [Kofleriaceae bacterium]